MEPIIEPKELEEIKKLLTPEVIKAQKEYKIRTFYDLVNALIEHPSWLEILRRLIIPSELLELPAKFDAFLKEFREFKESTERRLDRLEKDVETLKQDVAVLKQDVAVLKQDVAVLKQDVAVLKQDVAVLKQDVSGLKKDVSYLKGEFGRFKGKEFERTIRERYYAYFGRILTRSKRIELESLLPVIDELEESGKINIDQRESLLQLDLIVEGVSRATGEEMVLAVEISYSVYKEDLERVRERAEILALVLEKEVIPAIVGVEVSEEVSEIAEKMGILVIKASY